MRTRVLGMVDVIMRVPPLFVIDEILKISMGLPSFSGGPAAATGTIATVATAANGVSADMEDSLLDRLSLNTWPMEGGLLANGTAAAAMGGVDASEYFRLLSLTTLKFFTCLLGE